MHVDMSFKELKSYKGINPKPNDFDTYWDRALDELEKQSLEYKLKKAVFSPAYATCYHLYFKGVGGAKVHAKLVKPSPHIATGQAVVMFHGYTVNSGDWLDKLAYAAQGITVIALDCRGQGGLSEDNLLTTGTTVRGHIIRGLDDKNADSLYYRQVFLDTVQTVRILKTIEGVDPDRIGVYGQSQGGALAIACAALEPSIKHVYAVYPFLSDYERVWHMDIHNTAYKEIRYFFRCFDPTHQNHQKIFMKLGYIDIQHLADRIQASVEWVIAMRDVMCPPSTQFAVYNKIRSTKNMLIYHEFDHEHLPNQVDHSYQQFVDKL
ncbi:alpha/beta fold hydrolase [Gracilibacillus sp. YIM 98692]|uniref:acetylxylan esterase n=1 Tax=Gracilibacillus sp. YIM 98692 TaxID=2663532 RepID=UPI0013D12DEE|nr:alpha/beta fold hydrolase [Gracilibacillus sp. YIM 98692]